MAPRLTRRTYFATALGGAVVGGVVAALVVMAILPAGAATGGNAILGKANLAGATTTFRSGAGATIKVVNTNTSGTPLDLRAAAGTPPLTVNSPKRVIKLNSDLLDGFHARELLRVAHAETNDAPDKNGAILTTTLKAPRDGFLVITASVDSVSGWQNAFDEFGCHIKVDNVQAVGSDRWVRVDIGGVNHTDNGQENCSTNTTVAVAKGTHSIAFAINGRQDAGFLNAALSAIYVPFDGMGGRPDL